MSTSGTHSLATRWGTQLGVGIAGSTLPVLTHRVAEQGQVRGAKRRCLPGEPGSCGVVGSQQPLPPRACVASQHGLAAAFDEQQQRSAPLQQGLEDALASGLWPTTCGTGMPRPTSA